MRELVTFFALLAAITSGLKFSDTVRANPIGTADKPCFAPRPPGTPIARIEPIYPEEARRKCIEGYVDLEFDVGEDGRPKNIKVLYAYPPEIFDQAAISNVKQWCYRPSKLGGAGLPQFNRQSRYVFELESDCVPKEQKKEAPEWTNGKAPLPSIKPFPSHSCVWARPPLRNHGVRRP